MPHRRSILALLLLAPFAGAKDPPVTGDEVKKYRDIDKAVIEFMQTIDATAATVAISRDGTLLYSRGYGYADAAKTKPTPPDALMRIASVSKPITAAMIRTAARDKKLDLDAKAFELIGAKPPAKAKVADERVHDVTVAHLLAHKGGWDSATTGDQMFSGDKIARELKLTRPPKPADAVTYMLTQPLQFDPGSKEVYSNFGYCVLGRVLETVHKKPYADCLADEICKPLGTKDIKVGAVKKRDPREVWCPLLENDFTFDIMDAHGGLIASAPALCQFLDAYFLDGNPRKPGEWDYTFFGSLPGTTSMARERTDGWNVAVLLNNRRPKEYKEDGTVLKKAIDTVLDGIAAKK
jgi:CubicO group peptidase (beta-lactamase class C family)